MKKFAKTAKIGTLILISRVTKASIKVMIKFLMSTTRTILDLAIREDVICFKTLKITNCHFSCREEVT